MHVPLKRTPGRHAKIELEQAKAEAEAAEEPGR